MKIAIIGYGKMGKEIETIALQRGHTISCKFSSADELSFESNLHVDVAIEFTKPELAQKHIQICLDKNIPIVVGTTGWSDQIKRIESLVKETEGSLLHASNFSLGVHLFFEMSKKFSSIMKSHKEYTPSITETHHTEKMDKPSGTAISTAEMLLEQQDVYDKWGLVNKDLIDESTLPIHAERIPNVPGTHDITYTSDIDQISLIHKAKNRKGFALGAVIAAEFLKDRKGTFTMSDIINFA